ncbi:MAG: hypothetical protein LBS88_02405 [Tannerellaceae bacterium]|nr:hypothetical protein [Tannerellaceae bacterium]
MKKISMILTAVFLLLSVVTIQAQDKKQEEGDSFIGKWKLSVKGTPNGDVAMYVEFKRDEKGEIVGTIGDEANGVTAFTRVKAEKNTITAYWVAMGYDVYLFLEKAGEDKVEGTMMDMFDAVGTRVE